MIGQILKGYRFVDKIKSGSVGTVWRVTNDSNQVFALKVISEKNAVIPRKLRQFHREATLTRKLIHPHIIRVYEYVDSFKQPFFVMEYFPSENLKHCLGHHPGRVYTREFYILRQVAEALMYVHSHGIIHKDLKPENVLVSETSDIRLIDFSMGQTRMDRLFQFFRRSEGTPTYMSPEQVQGRRCDTRTDIYSFGVMTYELLAKRPPFVATTEQALLEKQLREDPPPMRTFVKTISPHLEKFCARLLAKRREDRFPDMSAVLHELSKWEKQDTEVRSRQVERSKSTTNIQDPSP